MRSLVLAALVLAALVTVLEAAASEARKTSLRVTFWEDGSQTAPNDTWTLWCDPAGGTLAHPTRACAKLGAGGVKLFAPVPARTVCTELYGGAQKARIVGTLDGKRVWATFTRTNGCQTARWNRIAPWLVPPGGVNS